MVTDAPYHPFSEIFFQQVGYNCFTCGDDRFNLGPGELCIMPAATPHQEVVRGNHFSAFVIVHHTERFVALKMEGSDGARPWGYPLKSYTCGNSELLAELLTQGACAHRGNRDLEQHLLCSYLGLVLDIIEQDTSESDSEYSPLVTQCMDLFFAEMRSENLTLQEAAKRLRCNADSLSARFSAEVGQTAIQYLTNLRMAQARRLLSQDRLAISEVAWACGYKDPNYFSRRFKAQHGCTPKAFRKSLGSTVGHSRRTEIQLPNRIS
ncbi:MAG: helix-turn-helix domain-containing protein [Verrucomicrobiota bacterium]